MQAQSLHRALAQIRAVAVKSGEAADVDIPQVDAGLAADDPFGEQPARAAGVGDAGGVEPGGDEEAAAVRRLTQDEIAVGRETLRPVEELAHLRGLETRRAMDRSPHQRLELIPILGQQLELERFGDAARAPGLRHRLEAAHEQAADLFLVIDEPVGIAHHRQVRRHAWNALGHDVEMLRRMQRRGDAGLAPEVARPLARAERHGLAGDLSGRGLEPDHAAIFSDEARDAHALANASAAGAGAFGERLREVRGVRLAVAGQPDRGEEIVGVHERPEPPRLGGRDELDLDAEAAGARHRALELDDALGRARDIDAAAGLPAGCLAGLRLERPVKLDAVAAHASHGAGRPHLADEARGVPSGPAGDPPLLQHQHVAPAELRQVIGEAAADDAAPDDHDLGLRRQACRVHSESRSSRGTPRPARRLARALSIRRRKRGSLSSRYSNQSSSDSKPMSTPAGLP